MGSYTHIADLMGLLSAIPAESIISRTVYNDPQVKVVLFGLAAGQELSEHTSSHPALLHILQGEVHLTLGDDVKEARAGAWVHMPAQFRHGVHAKTPVVMLLVLMKATIPGNRVE